MTTPWRRTEASHLVADIRAQQPEMAARKLPACRGRMGDPKRGASHGRADRAHNALRDPPRDPKRLYRRRLYLDSGRYDEGGAYWCHSQPRHWATAGAGADVLR